MTVTLGTVASQYAYSNFAPWRMMPRCSWSTPGRKPGTSTSVSNGTLNASQVRTNRAALSDASMSSTPASTSGCCATTPTLRPSTRANPQMMLRAQCACTSVNDPPSTIPRIATCMSYECLGESGTSASSASTSTSGACQSSADGT